MNIMVDIETFGTTEDSVILQIGAIPFGENLEYDTQFFVDISVSEQIRTYKRIVDSETLCWWLDAVSPQARVSVLERNQHETNVESLYNTLELFNEFVGLLFDDNNTENFIWANPPSFDLAIIKHAMRQCGITPAWKHYQERDVRTLHHINKMLGFGITKKSIGVKHNAIDDAKTQAVYVTDITNTLKSIREDASTYNIRHKSPYTYNKTVDTSSFDTFNTNSIGAV